MVKIAIIIVAAILIPTYAFAGWFGPSTYEECVLKNMKGVTSDQASRFIAAACRQQFPATPGPGKYDDVFGVDTQKKIKDLNSQTDTQGKQSSGR